MKRLVPLPGLSAALLLCWLLLNASVQPAHLALATLWAVLLPLSIQSLLPPLPRLRRPWLAARLLARFLADLLLANISVARLILGPPSRIRAGYLWIPLRLRDPLAQSLLAGMVTMTPGTLVARWSDDRRQLLVHALDLSDPAALCLAIQERYEAPLRDIFEPHLPADNSGSAA